MKLLKLLLLCTFGLQLTAKERPVTLAILAKDKAHVLSIYLDRIANQTYPKKIIYLYIRTNNNTDQTAQMLREWVQKVKDQYLDVYFDDSDVPQRVEKYGQHEWNCERFKVLSKIRQESVDWAFNHGSHYFVVDCDNFIFPNTLENLINTNMQIVAPLLLSHCAYSNFHGDIDENGYYKKCDNYYRILNRELKGIIEVPVVHCTYFLRYEILPQISYDDASERFEYVIFSDVARKAGIPQYLDNRHVYGYLTFAETFEQLAQDPWLNDFFNALKSFEKNH